MQLSTEISVFWNAVLCSLVGMHRRSSRKYVANGSEKDGDVRSECDEDECIDHENGDNDTDCNSR